MRRTNSFEVVPQSEQADIVLRRLLDASASLWNQLTYDRRQRFFAGESVWDCDGYYDEYVNVLGSATTQQITRVNDAAWRSFFETVEEPAEWSVKVSGHSAFPWWDGPTDEAFERACWQFHRPLEHALEEMVAEPA